ncbi:phytoene desaturase family protein [Salinispira pacifica]
MAKRVCVVGGGIGGLAAACFLARDGFEVTLLEKNSELGGRARPWRLDGFTFDMGPSWYLMPEVFEAFFARFNRNRSDYYELYRLDPYYRVFFQTGERVDISADLAETMRTFERLEQGGGEKLKRYLDEARYKYDVAMKRFLYREYRSLGDFFNRELMTEGLKLHVFQNLDGYVRRFFSDERARQILEYAMVFLGSSPSNAPALYSIMSHVDMNLGVFFPKGGMIALVQGLARLAAELGVRIETGAEVKSIRVEASRIIGVETETQTLESDALLVNADYHHVETSLLPRAYRSYSERYWRRRVVAPSMFIIYLGLDRKLESLVHHNLYFSTPWDDHFSAIFDRPAWPENPCYYVSCASFDDPSVAPAGKENVFILVPVAAGLDDSDDRREQFADRILDHFESMTGESIRAHTEIRRIFSQRDFQSDYNAFRGTALGLSHTLLQTAVFRPAMKSRRLPNLYYAGQYTHPGVGVPMTLIAAQVAAQRFVSEQRETR